MKVIFYVNTLFQVMVAIQLKRTVYCTDDADLVVTDRTGEKSEFSMRIKDKKIFRHVYYCNTKEFVAPGNLIKKTVCYLRGNVFPCSVLHQMDEIRESYDMFLYHNDNIDSQVLYDRLIKRNGEMNCIRFEEGYSIYIPLENTFTRGNRLRNFLGKKNLREVTEAVYVFNPGLLLVKFPYEVRELKKFDKNDKELLEIFNDIFDYHPDRAGTDALLHGALLCSLKQKYIIFEEAFLTDKEDVEDYELIKWIADSVGRENVLIKLHPRTEANRFQTLGIEVETHKVPWEVMQMNEDMSAKVLISIASGSILASKLYFDEDVRSLLLYQCLKSKPAKVSAEFEEYLKRFQKLFDHNLYIPENAEELKLYFAKMKEVRTEDDH